LSKTCSIAKHITSCKPKVYISRCGLAVDFPLVVNLLHDNQHKSKSGVWILKIFNWLTDKRSDLGLLAQWDTSIYWTKTTVKNPFAAALEAS